MLPCRRRWLLLRFGFDSSQDPFGLAIVVAFIEALRREEGRPFDQEYERQEERPVFGASSLALQFEGPRSTGGLRAQSLGGAGLRDEMDVVRDVAHGAAAVRPGAATPRRNPHAASRPPKSHGG